MILVRDAKESDDVVRPEFKRIWGDFEPTDINARNSRGHLFCTLRVGVVGRGLCRFCCSNHLLN